MSAQLPPLLYTKLRKVLEKSRTYPLQYHANPSRWSLPIPTGQLPCHIRTDRIRTLSWLSTLSSFLHGRSLLIYD